MLIFNYFLNLYKPVFKNINYNHELKKIFWKYKIQINFHYFHFVSRETVSFKKFSKFGLKFLNLQSFKCQYSANIRTHIATTTIAQTLPVSLLLLNNKYLWIYSC